MLEALNIQAVTKVLIATMQIIGGLTAILHLRFIDSFRRVMAAIASVFRFDIAISLGIGCLTDGTYIPSLLANFGMVALVVFVGGGAYVYESRKLQRDIDTADDDGHKTHLERHFRRLDPNGNGIQLSELRVFMEQLEVPPAEDILSQLFDRADTNNSGVIDFSEFYEAITHPDTTTSFEFNFAALIKQYEQAKIKAAAIGRLFLLIFLVYPSLTNRIFEGFQCRVLAPGISVLQSDYTIDCNSDQYAVLWTTCGILVIAWPIGMPALLFLMMYRARDKIAAGNEDTLQEFNFVLGDYDAKHWYWECVELGRKLILSGLIGMVGRKTVAQAVLATLVAFLFFALTFREMPYKARKLNTIKLFSEFQIFGVLLVCVVLQVEASGFATEVVTIEMYGIVQTALTLSIVPIVVYLLLTNIKSLEQEVEHEVHELVDDAKAEVFVEDEAVFENPVHVDQL